MQSARTRLLRAERDLARAEESLARVEQWQPGLLTSAEELADMREKARDRVLRLRARVSVRQAAADREAARDA